MSFKNFDEYNAAEAELILDPAIAPLAATIGAATGIRRVAGGLPQLYRRGYTNVQTLVVNQDTGEVEDQTSEDRQSSLTELFTAAKAKIEALVKEVNLRSKQFSDEYVGGACLTEGPSSRAALFEMAGALFDVDFSNGVYLRDTLNVERAFNQVSLWAASTFTTPLLYLPNRAFIKSDESRVYARHTIITGEFGSRQAYLMMIDGDKLLTVSNSDGLHVLFRRDGNSWTNLGASTSTDIVSALQNWGYTDIVSLGFSIDITYAIDITGDTSAGPSAHFDGSKLLANLIYQTEKVQSVINALSHLIES